MAYGSSARRAERQALRHIRVKVTYAPEQLAPVNDVYVGTTREVLEWVGSSKTRAKRALAYEIESLTPRVKLITALQNICEQAQGEVQ
jgi:hypothetical protein